MLQNTVSKINHKVLEGKWQINNKNISLSDKIIQEHQYQLYSEDHECYLAMVGVQAIIPKDKHNKLCRNIIIEIDIPVLRQHPEVGNYVMARLQDVARVLSKAYKPGITTLNQRVTTDCYENKLITIYREIQQEYLNQEGFTKLITYTHDINKTKPHLCNIMTQPLLRRVPNNSPDQSNNNSEDIVLNTYNRQRSHTL